MIIICCAYKCSKWVDSDDRSGSKLFHRFPGDETLMEKWKEATGDPSFLPTECSALCSDHFSKSDFEDFGGSVILKPYSIPIKFLKPEMNTSSDIAQAKETCLRQGKKTAENGNVRHPFLEIYGLQLSKQSDLNSDIRRIADFFGVCLLPSHIICSFIVEKKNTSCSEKSESIIVKFASLEKKMELLEGFKSSENTLVDSDRSETIFMTEEISPRNKQLLWLTGKMTSPGGNPDVTPGHNLVLPKNTIVKKVLKKVVQIPNVTSNIENIRTSPSMMVATKPHLKVSNTVVPNTVNPDVQVIDSSSSAEENDEPSEGNATSKTKPNADSPSYDFLVSSAEKRQLRVCLERLDSESCEKYNLPIRSTRKLIKEGSYKESSEEEVEDNNQNQMKESHKKMLNPGDTEDSDTSVVEVDCPPSKTSKPQRLQRNIRKPKTDNDFIYYSGFSKSNVKHSESRPNSKRKGRALVGKSKVQKLLEEWEHDDPLLLENCENVDESVNCVDKPTNTSKPGNDNTSDDENGTSQNNKNVIFIKKPADVLATEVLNATSKNSEEDSKVAPQPRCYTVNKKKSCSTNYSYSSKTVLNTTTSNTGTSSGGLLNGNTMPGSSELTSVMPFNHSLPLALSDITAAQLSVPIEIPDGVSQTPITIFPGVSPITSTPVLNGLGGGILPGVSPSSTPASGLVCNNFKLITNFDQLIDHLKERQVLQSHVEQILCKNFNGQQLYLLMRCKDPNRVLTDFSELQMKFALLVYLYSLTCFNYLTTVFALPNTSTLDRLLESSNYEPGFLKDSLQYIGQRMLFSDKLDLMDCILVIDTIPISKGAVWDPRNQLFSGRVQLFETFDYDTNFATSILLVMVCSLTNTLNIPLAYFSVNTVQPEFLARIISISIDKLFERGVKIWSVTLDASETSFNCAKFLGCKLDLDVDFVSFFLHAKSKSKVSILIDGHHLLRLARDSLANVEIISSDIGCIEWKYIKLLNEKFGLNFIDDTKHLSDTLTALEFNLSLAEALEAQIVEGDTTFASSRPTVTFIKKLDDIFSTFKCTNNRFKSTLPFEFTNYLQSLFLNEISPYFQSLKIENNAVYRQQKYPFIIGLFMSLNSFTYLCDEIKSNKLKVKKDLPTYKFSLDVIDAFYYNQFKSNGSKKDPDCLSFRRGIRKYLNHLLNDTMMLYEFTPLSIDFRSEKRSFWTIPSDEDPENNEKILFYMEMMSSLEVKVYSDCIMTFIGDRIVENIQRKIVCPRCIEMLRHNDDDICEYYYNTPVWRREFSLLYSDSPVRASRDVFRIIKLCEKVFQLTKPMVNLRYTSTNALSDLIINCTKTELAESFTTFPFSQYRHPVQEDVTYSTHETNLASLIIESYTRMRVSKIRLYSSLLNGL